MKNFFKLGFGAFFLLMLVACNGEVEISRGELPEQFATSVKPLLGTYSGRMEDGSIFTIDVRLDGRYLRATAAEDFLGKDCQARIGDLERIRVSAPGDKKEAIVVEGAVFALDPRNCGNKIAGRELFLERNADAKNISFGLKVLQRSEKSYFCETSARPENPRSGLDASFSRCSWETMDSFVRGSMERFLVQI